MVLLPDTVLPSDLYGYRIPSLTVECAAADKSSEPALFVPVAGNFHHADDKHLPRCGSSGQHEGPVNPGSPALRSMELPRYLTLIVNLSVAVFTFTLPGSLIVSFCFPLGSLASLILATPCTSLALPTTFLPR